MRKLLCFAFLAITVTSLAQQYKTGDYIPDTLLPPVLYPVNTHEIPETAFNQKISLFAFANLKGFEGHRVAWELQQVQKNFPEVQPYLFDIGPPIPKHDTAWLKRFCSVNELFLPVVPGAGNNLFKQLKLNNTPGFLLMAPTKKVLGLTSAESLYKEYPRHLPQLIKQFQQSLASEPIIKTDSSFYTPAPFSGWGKLLITENRENIFISNLAEGRVYRFNRRGKPIGQLGTGQLNTPTGMALADTALIVADRNDHRLKAVHLKTGKTEVLYGNGDMAMIKVGKKNRRSPLSFPYDVVVKNGSYLTTMPGDHQIWDFYIGQDTAFFYAGDGYKTNLYLDGFRYEARCSYPTDIESVGDVIYFADEGINVIRKIHKGYLRTLTATFYNHKFTTLTAFEVKGHQLFTLDAYEKKLVIFDLDEENKPLVVNLDDVKKGLPAGAFPVDIEMYGDKQLLILLSEGKKHLLYKPGKAKFKILKLKVN